MLFYIIVIALAANKEDMYEDEQVDEEEGKELAKELGAIFQKTSAKEARGIDTLFEKIGKKFINPSHDFENDIINKKKKPVKLVENKNNNKTQKKGCC